MATSWRSLNREQKAKGTAAILDESNAWRFFFFNNLTIHLTHLYGLSMEGSRILGQRFFKLCFVLF